MRKEIVDKIASGINNKTVNLEQLQINDEEISDIVKKIKEENPYIELINLDNNNLGDAGSMVLAKELEDFSRLTELSLQFNRIDQEGALAIFALKKERPDLKILFRGNKIKLSDEMNAIECQAISVRI